MITSATRLMAVLGHPVAHSISPQMQNAALQSLGIDAVYFAFDILPEYLPTAVDGLKAVGFLGCNVTIPHKTAMFDLVDERTREAELIGAVNTVAYRDDRLIGHNTDGLGYVRSLMEEQSIDLSRARVALIGAGGAARAIACQLALVPVKHLSIVNRSVERARELAVHVESLVDASWYGTDDAAQALKTADLLIHASPVGMHPHMDATPVPSRLLRQGMIVSDTVYNPRQTLLLREASERGAFTHGGLGMLIHQGGEALTFWTGLPAPIPLMREAAERALKGVFK